VVVIQSFKPEFTVGDDKMATAVAPRGMGAMAPPAEPAKVVEEYIPDIIEERRKDSEGRSVTNQYVRGKLLGKVRSRSIIEFGSLAVGKVHSQLYQSMGPAEASVLHIL
jgi:hypothetical protein